MHTYSEEDTKLRFITPVIEKAGWNKTQMRLEYSYTNGEIKVKGTQTTRGKKKRCDYVLFYKPSTLPLAIVEAKKTTEKASSGLQQVIKYGTDLDVPYVYSTNGKEWIEFNRLTGKERNIQASDFPSPEALFLQYQKDKHYTPEAVELIKSEFHFDALKQFEPRYYQRIAINRTLDAIAEGQKRILLVMATGTGKTFTAFQIIHRLYSTKQKKKILYLADRNILVDQSMQQDFKPFSKVMTKIEKRTFDSSYDIYFALYQQLAGEKGEEPFRAFKPEFFDLIVIDECHRGSANEESLWRNILEYFSSATQIGLTATPKETKEVSNSEYFGDPIYTYSLKQGIQDGFLAPYKVLRVSLNIDLEGWRPKKGQTDDKGELIEDRIYNIKDFDRNIVLEHRTKLVAKRITEFLQTNDPMAKTIVFCVDIDHADRLRSELVKLNAAQMQKDSRYIMKITGDDKEGKAQLDNFIDTESAYPVIVTTSQLMTTGVDCKTCKLIVLDRCIDSMTEFKQIIGRGTRLLEKKGKSYFTIMDFRGNTKNFSDPTFDGDPVKIKDVKDSDPIPSDDDDDDLMPNIGGKPNESNEPSNPFFPINGANDEEKRREKVVVKGGYLNIKIINETVQYIGADGKLITENLTDFSRENVLNQYASLKDFITKWNSEAKKTVILKELEKHGIFLDALRKQCPIQDIDDFDLICHIAFDQPPLTRNERAENVKKRGYLFKYQGLAKEVLQALLDKYAEHGVTEIENINTLKNPPFNHIGPPIKIVKDIFGGKNHYEAMLNDLEKELYMA